LKKVEKQQFAESSQKRSQVDEQTKKTKTRKTKIQKKVAPAAAPPIL
jgi:hypothetical protein